MSEPVWLEREALLQLHQIGLKQFGGAPGVRDTGLLEAALMRARQVHAYEPEADIFALAAAYAGGFVRNHPFVDGNKRAGFAAALVFLAANGWDLEASSDEATAQVVGLAARDVTEEAFAGWLLSRCVPLTA